MYKSDLSEHNKMPVNWYLSIVYNVYTTTGRKPNTYGVTV